MKKGGRGFGSTFVSLIFSLVLIGFILAALQLLGITSVEDSIDVAKKKAKEYTVCIPAGECGIATVISDIPEILKGTTSSTSWIINDDKPSSNSADKESGSQASNTAEEANVSNTKENLIGEEEKGYRGPEKGEPFVNNSGRISKTQALEELGKLELVSDKEDEEKKVGYSRREWKHWSSVRGCWNTRSEILNRDAVPGTVSYLDKKKKSSNYDEACTIGLIGKDGEVSTKNSGAWIDPYSGKRIEDPKDVDIDHIIPLSNAARQGGQKWSLEQKEKFANDPDNLLATSAKENRKKGEKGPAKYMPPLKSYHCQYSKSYINLSHKYNLTITKSDKKVLEQALDACVN